MMSPLLTRLLLAIVLVLNGAGAVLAGARALAVPAAATAAVPQKAHSPAEATAAMPGCHAATPAQDASAGAGAAADASASEAPGHGHCCQDACHCVCTLQAHASPVFPASPPLRTVAGLAPFPGWADPYPALLLRPPIA